MTVISIEIEQLIYSRVEPNISPWGKNGFQTVYRANSLSAKTIEIVEANVQCFRPSVPTQSRYQFFPVETDKYAITHSVQIDPNTEIVDRSGRTGAFIAHCVICGRESLAKIENNPFAIIDCFDFIADPVKMIERYGDQHGNIPLATVSVNFPLNIASDGWNSHEIKPLLVVAQHVSKSQRNLQSVLAVGKTDATLRMLRLLFELLDQDSRLNCSFDTYIDGCPVKRDKYWLVGSLRRQSGFQVDVSIDSHRVTSRETFELNNQDMYATWLKGVFEKQNLQMILDNARSAQQLSIAFSRSRTPPWAEISVESQHEFFQLFNDEILKNIQKSFTNILTDNLADELTQYAQTKWDSAQLLEAGATQKPNRSNVSMLVLEWLDGRLTTPNNTDWERIQFLAQETDNTLLLFVAATMRRKPDTDARDRALQEMNADTFQNALKYMADPIPPVNYISGKHLDVLLTNPQIQNVPGSELVDLMIAVIKHGDIDKLALLSANVSILEKKEFQRLRKELKNELSLPKEFDRAIAIHEKRLKLDKSILTRLLRR